MEIKLLFTWVLIILLWVVILKYYFLILNNLGLINYWKPKLKDWLKYYIKDI